MSRIAGLAARVLEGAWSERGFVDQASKAGAVTWIACAGAASTSATAGEERGSGPETGAGGALLGFLVGERIFDELHVLSLGVAPSHRRHGIARALVGRALEAATSAGADVVHLELRASNRAARALYEGFGFVEVGRRPRYYPGRDPGGRDPSGRDPSSRDPRSEEESPSERSTSNGREDAVLMTLELRASQGA